MELIIVFYITHKYFISRVESVCDEFLIYKISVFCEMESFEKSDPLQRPINQFRLKAQAQ
jgi:hypothetical protein